MSSKPEPDFEFFRLNMGQVRGKLKVGCIFLPTVPVHMC